MLPCKDCLPAQETLVQSLGREDPLEEMSAHSSLLAWEIPFTEELGGLRSAGLQRDMTERLRTQALRVDSFASYPQGSPSSSLAVDRKQRFCRCERLGGVRGARRGGVGGGLGLCSLHPSAPSSHPQAAGAYLLGNAAEAGVRPRRGCAVFNTGSSVAMCWWSLELCASISWREVAPASVPGQGPRSRKLHSIAEKKRSEVTEHVSGTGGADGAAVGSRGAGGAGADRAEPSRGGLAVDDCPLPWEDARETSLVPVTDTSPSSAGDAGLIPNWGAEIPPASWPKNQNET